MADGAEAGLRWIERLEAGGALADYYLLHAARADLLRRAGRYEEAQQAYRQALAHNRNRAVHAYLLRRLLETESAGTGEGRNNK